MEKCKWIKPEFQLICDRFVWFNPSICGFGVEGVFRSEFGIMVDGNRWILCSSLIIIENDRLIYRMMHHRSSNFIVII